MTFSAMASPWVNPDRWNSASATTARSMTVFRIDSSSPDPPADSPASLRGGKAGPASRLRRFGSRYRKGSGRSGAHGLPNHAAAGPALRCRGASPADHPARSGEARKRSGAFAPVVRPSTMLGTTLSQSKGRRPCRRSWSSSISRTGAACPASGTGKSRHAPPRSAPSAAPHRSPAWCRMRSLSEIRAHGKRTTETHFRNVRR